jgi:hypothetical protein
MADVLSESTFLLFWAWGFWAALRFLRAGCFGWLPVTVGFGALAYLSRPEGLLLPAALLATLLLVPLLPSTRLNRPRWCAAMAFLALGAAGLVGPYVALKGGLGTKPAIARLLGTAPPSDPLAVERKEPLDPNQSTARTYVLAVRTMAVAVRDAVTVPLLVLALVGLFMADATGPLARPWLFVKIVLAVAALALVRLHATGGYCSPRHALVLALPLIASAAYGLVRLLGLVSIPGAWLGLGEGRFRPGPAVWALALGGLAWLNCPALLAAVNADLAAYRDAGRFLEQNTPPDAHVVDVTGWALFYGQRQGYTFADLIKAFGDPTVRWVVVREAHMHGPWIYCHQLRQLVAGLSPTATFPAVHQHRIAQVFVFDRRQAPGQPVAGTPGPVRR